jgi:hypothetical protein
MSIDDFIAANADPIWLHQEGLWWLIPEEEGPGTFALEP